MQNLREHQYSRGSREKRHKFKKQQTKNRPWKLKSNFLNGRKKTGQNRVLENERSEQLKHKRLLPLEITDGAHTCTFCLQKHIPVKPKTYYTFRTQTNTLKYAGRSLSEFYTIQGTQYHTNNRGALSTSDINIEMAKRNKVLRAQKDVRAQPEQDSGAKHVLG